jgi:hypothetical protein
MVYQWGLLHFMASAIGVYAIMKYRTGLQRRVCVWGVNMVYWYSYAEIHIKNAIKPYIWERPQRLIDEGSLFYLKNNCKLELKKHCQSITLPDSMDLMIYSSPSLSVIVDIVDDDDEWLDNSKIKSDTEFINITVQFENDPAYYDISLNDCSMNLYAVDNRINKYIIWYLSKLQHGVDKYGSPYSIQLMDHNVNIMNYNETTTIIIQKVGYYIEQDEHLYNNTVPVSN